MKNEKNSVFPKRDVVKGFVKGSKKSKNGLISDEQFFLKKISKESFGQIKHLSAVFMSNSILLNRMVLSESLFTLTFLRCVFFLMRVIFQVVS